MRCSRAPAVLALLLLAPCGARAEPVDPRPLVFVGNERIAPVVYLESGAPRGVAVDLVRALAPHLGQPVEIRAMDWVRAQELVRSGEADALIQMNPTPERRALYDFSETLLESRFAIFTSASRVGLSGPSGLRGLRVGVEAGGLPRQVLERDPGVLLVLVPDFLDGFRRLNAGALDAVVVDERVGSYVLAEHRIGGIRIATEPVAFSSSAIAVRKGNARLLEAIDHGLRVIKADGTYARVLRDWAPKEVVFQTREQLTREAYRTASTVLLAMLLLAAAWAAILVRELRRRRAAEAAVRALNAELEARVVARTAQLETANKELEAFAYSVAHDLRAPLRHIDGYLGLLGRRLAPNVSEDGRRCMAQISDAALRMSALIDDLLAFARMGRAEMSRGAVNLGALVQAIQRDLEPVTRGRAVSWRVGDLPVVRGDEALLRVALESLVSNALKFTRPREEAHIEIGAAPGSTGEVVVFVRDNGVGFDPAHAGKLFGVFQRLHGAKEFEGTGIGLAHVRQIVDRHGGRAWAEGRLGEGATFYCALPRA